MITISTMRDEEYDDFLEMAALLWPDWEDDELREEFDELLAENTMTILMARTEEDKTIGFAQVSIRTDYVPGAEDSPVAFLEGIYVRESARKQGIGRQLAEAAMQWGRDRGCSEMGSDALIDNLDSHRFHASIGFSEVERLVTFIKKI